PNPLLQNHPFMGLHPPLLYLGYVLTAVPFAYAIASLALGEGGDRWLVATRRFALVSWALLGVGIGAGAWWSYAVLGWGGYWAWDPVENAAIMPWLTATAYLHSVMVEEKRRLLRTWNISLVVATFALTILGTFLTRSGVVNSVHSFTQSAIGPLLLGYLTAILVLSVGLLLWRSPQLRDGGHARAAVHRAGRRRRGRGRRRVAHRDDRGRRGAHVRARRVRRRDGRAGVRSRRACPARAARRDRDDGVRQPLSPERAPLRRLCRSPRHRPGGPRRRDEPGADRGRGEDARSGRDPCRRRVRGAPRRRPLRRGAAARFGRRGSGDQRERRERSAAPGARGVPEQPGRGGCAGHRRGAARRPV